MNKRVFCIAFSFISVFFTVSGTLEEKDIIVHSSTVPKGMQMVWNDEFNQKELDLNKWFPHYYSTLDFYYRTNFDDFRMDNLPQAAIAFTDSTIILKTNDAVPQRNYWPSGRKVSSIQTYDWNSDRNLMENKIGGYFEARIRRSATPEAEQANSAFWFDSPGPDLKYYIEKGNEIQGVEGIRPRGQVFEIDLCEYVTTEIVLHGNVSPEGRFERNIGHFIIPGEYNNKWTTHGMLWSPAGLKFYVDGKLVAESWDPNDIKSPNHTMNMFFGAYGNGGEVIMEVDYVRYYQWHMEDANELPNPGFEYEGELFPWEGGGLVTTNAASDGEYGVELLKDSMIYQYVYLEHSSDYEMSFQAKGAGKFKVKVENITQVTGEIEEVYESIIDLEPDFEKHTLSFFTNPEYADHMRTVKISFINEGDNPVCIDNIQVIKVRTFPCPDFFTF